MGSLVLISRDIDDRLGCASIGMEASNIALPFSMRPSPDNFVYSPLSLRTFSCLSQYISRHMSMGDEHWDWRN